MAAAAPVLDADPRRDRSQRAEHDAVAVLRERLWQLLPPSSRAAATSIASRSVALRQGGRANWWLEQSLAKSGSAPATGRTGGDARRDRRDITTGGLRAMLTRTLAGRAGGAGA